MFSLSIRFSPNIFSNVLPILEALEFNCKYVDANRDFAGPSKPDAKMSNGILSVNLHRNVPEEKKPVTISIK